MCFDEFQMIIVVIFTIILTWYSFYWYVPSEPIINVNVKTPSTQKTTSTFNKAFPLGTYVPEMSSGVVGYLVDTDTNQHPLMLERTYGNRYYYHTVLDSSSNIPIEVNGNPRSMELFDGDSVTVNGKTMTVKIYRTSLFP